MAENLYGITGISEARRPDKDGYGETNQFYLVHRVYGLLINYMFLCNEQRNLEIGRHPPFGLTQQIK